MTPGLVSTIIPVYNRPEWLREAVESVIAQTWRPIEVVIVDDGSNDDTPIIAAELARDNPREVRCIRIDNSGPGPAREMGRQMARGEFLQYLDSDDRLLPKKFLIQVSALREKPECGIAYGKTRLIDSAGNTLQTPYKWTGKRIPFLFPKLLVDRWWCTHTPLYRRDITDRAGSWSNLRYSQDWEYDARIGAMNVKLAFCDAEVSEHRQHKFQRQTGGGKWLSSSEKVRFFQSIFEHARRAGVVRTAPEMGHFSRWVFHHARQCAAVGDADAARSCIEISLAAADGTARDIRLYHRLALVFGWRTIGQLGRLLEILKWKPNSGKTLRQSWMAQIDRGT